MAYSAKILKDSLSPAGMRLTTMEITLPRCMLPEFNTHRMFSRNSASSRAIPVEKMLKRVQEDPFLPVYWGKNQKGMQASEELTGYELEKCKKYWLEARDHSVSVVEDLLRMGLHKQITNRLLEPFLWHTVIVSATEWENFFALRCHKDAQPEIKVIAEMMRDLYCANVPTQNNVWHLPLMDDFDDLVEAWHAGKFQGEMWDVLCKISVGRCARVSYLTHDGKRDPQADIDLCERLVKSGHMSPAEHVARPLTHEETQNLHSNDPKDVFYGNFRGWKSYRKMLPNEAVFCTTSI